MTALWPGLKLVYGKPRHSQSQGSVERANRDVENLIACWQAENNSTNWSKALNIIQFQKNSKWHSGIDREPFMAMFGRKQANNCKCKKAKQMCNSRCHKTSIMCLNDE